MPGPGSGAEAAEAAAACRAAGDEADEPAGGGADGARAAARGGAAAGGAKPEGNAVYKIDPEGFVTEVFREPVLVLAMVEDHGTLLIATGNEGQIYQVNPAAGETVVLAKVEPKDVIALLPAQRRAGLPGAGRRRAASPP